MKSVLTIIGIMGQPTMTLYMHKARQNFIAVDHRKAPWILIVDTQSFMIAR